MVDGSHHKWVNCTKFVPCPVRHTKFSSCLKKLIFYMRKVRKMCLLYGTLSRKHVFLPYFKVITVFRPPVVQNTNFNEKPSMPLGLNHSRPLFLGIRFFGFRRWGLGGRLGLTLKKTEHNQGSTVETAVGGGRWRLGIQ